MATEISSSNEIENLKKNEERTNRDYKKLKIHKENRLILKNLRFYLFLLYG